MTKRILLVAAVLMLALSLAGTAWAGPTMDRIMKNGVLKVGTNPQYPPLMMKNKKGQVFGYEADMARMLASSLKVKIKFVPLPFKDLIPALKTGMVDMVLNGLTMTAERNAKIMFVGPYLAGGQSVLTRLEMTAKFQGLPSFNKPGVTVSAGKGTTGEMIVKQVLPKAKYIAAADQQAALDLLLAKKVQVVVADYPFCSFSSFRYRSQGIVTGDKPFTFEAYGIAIAPGDQLFENLVQNFLTIVKGSGQLQMLDQKWFKNAGWVKELAK